jgi:hypothetical protein
MTPSIVAVGGGGHATRRASAPGVSVAHGFDRVVLINSRLFHIQVNFCYPTRTVGRVCSIMGAACRKGKNVFTLGHHNIIFGVGDTLGETVGVALGDSLGVPVSTIIGETPGPLLV